MIYNQINVESVKYYIKTVIRYDKTPCMSTIIITQSVLQVKMSHSVYCTQNMRMDLLFMAHNSTVISFD